MGLFDIINIPFAFIMRLFDSFTGSYALTLLLFTLVVKLVFVPLGIKQQKNQIKMAALRPKEEVIRKKYAGRTDKTTQQKMQQEILELQQKENVSPFGGCLPLIVQLVVIMSVYSIIREPLTYICGLSDEILLELSTKFGWMTTQGQAILADGSNLNLLDQINAIAVTPNLGDVLASYDAASLPNLNFFGLNLGITPSQVWGAFGAKEEMVVLGGIPTFMNVVSYMIIPVVCFLLQVVTMKLTRKFTYQSPAAQDAQAGCSMKMMDWMMPLMSLYFCFSFSSAIGLYWIFSNIFSFAQSFILAKVMPVPVYSEDDIKKAEKEMKEKGYDLKRSELKRVRSLHHIDDEDYDTLPEVTTEAQCANHTLLNGEKTETKAKGKKPTVKD